MGELNVTGKEDILRYLIPSGDLNEADLAALRYLVLKFPYSQPLQFAYLNALYIHDKAAYDEYLPKAAAYAPKREVLHRFIHDPQHFIDYNLPGADANEAIIPAEPTAELIREADGEIAGVPEIADEIPVPVIETVIPDAEIPEATSEYEPESVIYDIPDNIGTLTPEAGGLIIPSVDIINDPQPPADTISQVITTVDEPKLEDAARIASKDYFIFDQSEIDPLKPAPVAAEALNNDTPDAEDAKVTKYHDDTMPYTFLWWLHKTRSEYATSYQPFANTQVTHGSRPVGELNQQIIENIFHIQPELNTFEAAAIAQSIEAELKNKEDRLINKFIQEEPQIKPPQANKLDTENKARKSSEDSLDLVSETLARIYTDQMLYHKAIEIYRKLSLKFPDKKLYFAGQITELEQKIN